jgi:damage-control phosphatase, subfamily I
MITKIANTRSIIDERCVQCFLKTYKHLFHKFKVAESHQKDFLEFFSETVKTNGFLTTPEIQRMLNKSFCNIIGISDPFAAEKKSSNKIALDLYDAWKPKVTASKNPFDLALRLAIAGNIMDYGANISFDIQQTITRVLMDNFAIDHSQLLREKVSDAKDILYLGDNAGEIVFDKLFIETMIHNNVIYVVKSKPVLNDVTMKDASQVGMFDVASVITNGFDAPSTVLSRCSNEFLRFYESADLIISKGQGNLEGLLPHSDPRIFFFLMVKCDIIAKRLNVKKGDFVVYNQFAEI